MILILGVWIYNDIILRPIFRKILPGLTNEVSKHDGETKHGQDFEESYGSPSPTKSPSAGKTEEIIAIRDISKSVAENIHGL